MNQKKNAKSLRVMTKWEAIRKKVHYCYRNIEKYNNRGVQKKDFQF